MHHLLSTLKLHIAVYKDDQLIYLLTSDASLCQLGRITTTKKLPGTILTSFLCPLQSPHSFIYFLFQILFYLTFQRPGRSTLTDTSVILLYSWYIPFTILFSYILLTCPYYRGVFLFTHFTSPQFIPSPFSAKLYAQHIAISTIVVPACNRRNGNPTGKDIVSIPGQRHGGDIASVAPSPDGDPTLIHKVQVVTQPPCYCHLVVHFLSSQGMVYLRHSSWDAVLSPKL